MNKTKQIGLTDQEIVDGLKKRDGKITKEYFYSYCRIAYYVYDKKYDLSSKPYMDFFSIAHEYYLSLDKHDFKQLEDRKPGMALKTWMVNGFRFVLLDRMKVYAKENQMLSLEMRVENSQLKFDIPDSDYKKEVRRMINDICTQFYQRDSRASIILQMMLIEGFKGNEVSVQLGISPSAVAQRYHKMLKEVIIPYFKNNFEMPDSANPEMYEQTASDTGLLQKLASPCYCCIQTKNDMEEQNYTKRITPNYIQKLHPNEIFVFGSNLAGMHGGGAARIAHLHFGAILGNGDGIQGQSYAIPTMQGGTDTIQPYVDQFIQYAQTHPDKTFLVTRIGCGIAGFDADDIAPLFKQAKNVANIYLPADFWEILI